MPNFVIYLYRSQYHNLKAGLYLIGKIKLGIFAHIIDAGPLK